jgi:protein-S-isoprenylcysteine O-methyltransferase Ste14
MLRRLSSALASLSEKPRSSVQRVIYLVLGATGALVLVPWLLIVAGRWVHSWIPFAVPRFVELAIAAACIPAGLFFFVWSTGTMWKLGKGTPNPAAPTQHLVVEGPYKLCRNPIELAGILYFLGLGALVDSLAVGLFAMLFPVVFGSAYFKFVEEKELVLRFGDEYVAYRERTPFVIPRRSAR